MKKIFSILTLLIAFTLSQAQTQPNLPTGAKPYSGNLFRDLSGNIWTGYAGSYTNLGSMFKVDSLLAAKLDTAALSGFYTKSQVDAFLALKQNLITGAATTIVSDDLTANRALISNGDGKVAVSVANSTELGYLLGLTGNVQDQLGTKIDTVLLGKPNGIPLMDANGKIQMVNIPDQLIGAVNYQGTWSALTNTPTLPATPGSEIKGHYYVASDSGVFNGVTYLPNDWIISSGTVWQKIEATNYVNRVNGMTGNVSVAFLNLPDAPSTYTGQGGKLVAVKSDLSGLEFISSPAPQTLSLGSDAGQISISGGNSVNLLTISTGTNTADFQDMVNARPNYSVSSFTTSGGSTGVPGEATGIGLLIKRAGSGTAAFSLYRRTGVNAPPYVSWTNTSGVWQPWETMATREWATANFVNTTGNQTGIAGNKEWGGNQTFTSTRAINIDRPVGNSRDIFFKTSGSDRWRLYINTENESGENAGSNFSINNFDDNGALLSNAFTIRRSDGIVSVASLAGAGTRMVTASSTGVLGTAEIPAALTASNGIQINSGVISPVYGTGANTVAQGNDSRIINGQTAFGWGDFRGFGLGLSSARSIPGNDLTVEQKLPTGFYSVYTSTTGLPFSGSGSLLNMWGGVSGGSNSQIAMRSNNTGTSEMFFRGQSGTGVFTPWYEVYHSGNLRSNAENDARYIQTANLTTSSLAELNTGTETTGKLQSAKNLSDWLTGKNYLTSVPVATATVPGIVELFSNTVQSVAANAVTATASRTYGVQLNSDGQAVVNVPWTGGTSYGNMLLADLNTGTDTTGRSIAAKTLTDWLSAKNYIPVGANNTLLNNNAGFISVGTGNDQVRKNEDLDARYAQFSDVPDVPEWVMNIAESDITSWGNKVSTVSVQQGIKNLGTATAPDLAIDSVKLEQIETIQPGELIGRGGGKANTWTEAASPTGSPGSWPATFKGTWSPSVTYDNLDGVVYGDVLYYSIGGSNTNRVPTDNPTWWQAYSSIVVRGYWGPSVNYDANDYVYFQDNNKWYQTSAPISVVAPTDPSSSAVPGPPVRITIGPGLFMGDDNVLRAGGSSSISELVAAGANMTRTGSGTTADPYVFSATTGGSGSVTLIPGTNISITGNGTIGYTITNTYTLPTSTDSQLGGIKLGSNTVQTVGANAVSSVAGRTYAVQLNSDGQAVVNVPWDGSGGGGGGITQLSGDVTTPGGGSGVATIANGAVTLSKMANLSAGTFIGRTGSSGTPQALTANQARIALSTTAANTTTTIDMSGARLQRLNPISSNTTYTLSNNVDGANVQCTVYNSGGSTVQVNVTGAVGLGDITIPAGKAAVMSITNFGDGQVRYTIVTEI